MCVQRSSVTIQASIPLDKKLSYLPGIMPADAGFSFLRNITPIILRILLGDTPIRRNERPK